MPSSILAYDLFPKWDTTPGYQSSENCDWVRVIIALALRRNVQSSIITVDILDV